MRRIVEIKALSKKRLFIKYSDGLEGILNLESLTKHHQYKELRLINKFEDAYIHSETGDIIINGNIELCKNAAYEMLNLKKQIEALGINLN